MVFNPLLDSVVVFQVTKLSAGKFLFTAVPVTKIRAVFKTLFSESEFLSPYGIRSLSKVCTQFCNDC